MAASIFGCAQAKLPNRIEVVISGHVTIGPLEPVQVVGQTPKVPKGFYAAYRLVVMDAEGKKEVKRVVINETGDYRMTLLPGTYQVGCLAGSPNKLTMWEKFVVKAGKPIKKNFDVDTGIR